MFENLFPNAHGFKLVVVVFAALISVACIFAFVHSLYQLWADYNEKEQILCSIDDEFADRDDPHAMLYRDNPFEPLSVRLITPERILIGHVGLFTFKSGFEMVAWICGNLQGEDRQQAVVAEGRREYALYNRWAILVRLTEDEFEWIS